MKKTCKYCGNLFTPTVPWKEYCENSCKLAAWAISKARKVNKAALREAQKAIK